MALSLEQRRIGGWIGGALVQHVVSAVQAHQVIRDEAARVEHATADLAFGLGAHDGRAPFLGAVVPLGRPARTERGRNLGLLGRSRFGLGRPWALDHVTHGDHRGAQPARRGGTTPGGERFDPRNPARDV